MQTHSADKNFECGRCHKTFALKSYLNKHLESACFKDENCPLIIDESSNSNPATPSLPIDVVIPTISNNIPTKSNVTTNIVLPRSTNTIQITASFGG